jgi:hypothetical protein
LFHRQPKFRKTEYQIGYNQTADYAKHHHRDQIGIGSRRDDPIPRLLQTILGFCGRLKFVGAQVFRGTILIGCGSPARLLD